MVGGCLSTTVTVKEQLAVWAAASLAVQVTVVVATGKNDPGAGVQEVVTGGVPPVTVGLKRTSAPHWSRSLSCVMLGGQTICSGDTEGVKLKLRMSCTAAAPP